MSGYLLTWVTKHLAVGHAPMSFAELDDIKEQGIDAIVNLCEEFSDLHELEEQAGFEVFYLPITDEHAPEMKEMEKGLEWMDEAIYLGKKVLVHCKHGVGRTGTFVTAYLLRRGLGMRKAEKILRKTRANPTNFSQWWLLRKYGKKEGKLKISEATIENRSAEPDLSEYYARYEQLLRRVDAMAKASSPEGALPVDCVFCSTVFSLSPIEAIYLNEKVNKGLTNRQRADVIARAVSTVRIVDRDPPPEKETALCPLNNNGECMLHNCRPIHCRIRGIEFSEKQMEEISRELSLLSTEITSHFFKKDITIPLPSVHRTDAVSGKFIQKYFQFMAEQKKNQ